MEIKQDQDFDTPSIFVFKIRSTLTRDHYLRRLKIFNHIDLLPEKNINERCNYFAEKGKDTPD